MNESPHSIGARVDSLLEQLWDARGTDLQLAVGAPPMLRIDGHLVPVVGEPVLTPAGVTTLLEEILSPAQASVWADVFELDFSFGWRQHARIRGNAYTERGNAAVALRMVPRVIPTPESLGVPEVVRELALNHQGLILVTGPAGSGKSTTLASLIGVINDERAAHVITVEDPIEYVHEHRRSLINQREVGIDTESFHNALRSVLREDPDVVLVGEMRDNESIAMALTTAETGHLVMTTLHTNDAAQSLARMVDVFPANQQEQIRVQLAAALSCVVYQRLLPRVGGGMVAAFEVLVATPAVRNLIKEGKTHQLRNSMVSGSRDRMLTLEQSLSKLVQEGQVTLEDAVVRSLHPKDIELEPRVRMEMAGQR